MIYTIASTLAFWLIFTIWNRNDLFNFAIKLAFLALALGGSFESLAALGYIVRAGQ